ncbi:anti-sigma factor domain-containing protein [Synoicihabitans lomoniglobus]|uniref:Regulator of SigK n=1 Tax=Synoicihabitans lomoniglobus TaxID=2909285 RepID=A0AAF0CMD3_9BACT|nr:anti-sigma factor [Opitutaceae bacterium LMO-M01]WED63948.1 anti-sigma factor [Opitutaceae bacterium LMO-M01]
MTDRDQELIADYVLGELLPGDNAAFEARMQQDAKLARAVSEMEEIIALGVLSDTPAVSPSRKLRSRVLASIEPRPTATEATSRAEQPDEAPDESAPIPFPAVAAWGWGVAAALAVGATVLTFNLKERGDTIVNLETELASARDSLESVSEDLARSFLDRDALSSRVAELESRQRLDTLRIAAMTSQLEEAASYGFAVFDPETDDGVIEVINMPTIDGDTQDFQLWVVDPQYPNPVDGGIIQVDESGRTRVRFHAKQPVSEVAAFAISLERKGGVPVAEGPMVLVGAL